MRLITRVGFTAAALLIVVGTASFFYERRRAGRTRTTGSP